MAESTTLFIGLDVHKDSISVAYASGGGDAPPRFVGPIGTRQRDIDKMVRQLQSRPSRVVFASEAGPCGYGLHRDLTGKGLDCRVVAPSLIPSWKAQLRLCRHLRRLAARGKHANVVVTAIAREILAFMWAIAQMVKAPA